METRDLIAARFGRRRFLIVAGAAAGSAILAACGGGTATDTPKPAATTGAAPSTAASTAAPTVASAAGSITASGSAAASTTGGGSIHTMVIEAFDFGYKTLGSIPGGPTRVQMRNTGKELHHAQFMLLNPGVTPDELGAAFGKGPDAAFGLVTFPGGPGAILPGGSTEVILSLAAGQYMIACFIAGADNVPHLAKGMLMPLTVTAAPTAATPLPAVNGAITLYDFNFTLPAVRSMYTVANTGAQFHEFSVNRLPPGKTVDDVKAYFAASMPPDGPPPIAPMGGMNALTKVSTGITVLDLTPGNYVAICNVPDQSKPNGDSHAHLGMIKGFTVT